SNNGHDQLDTQTVHREHHYHQHARHSSLSLFSTPSSVSGGIRSSRTNAIMRSFRFTWRFTMRFYDNPRECRSSSESSKIPKPSAMYDLAPGRLLVSTPGSD